MMKSLVHDERNHLRFEIERITAKLYAATAMRYSEGKVKIIIPLEDVSKEISP